MSYPVTIRLSNYYSYKCYYKLLKYGLCQSKMRTSRAPYTILCTANKSGQLCISSSLWINTGRKWMWFYNDSLHTGSICCQRNPFKAALASHVYYFLFLWQICIFSFSYFLPLKHTLPRTCFDFCPLTWMVVSFKEAHKQFSVVSVQWKLYKTCLLTYFCFFCLVFITFVTSSFYFILSHFSVESHTSQVFSSALLSILVETQSAWG